MEGERFELQVKVGAGGMGTVWRALDRTTNAVVAFKVLRDPEHGDVNRFVHEAHVLAGLDHAHIVRHVAHGLTDTGEPYIAMEWLEGEDLESRLTREGLTTEQSLQLGKHVASALGAAHARGIVHRDIKPSNLFLVNGDVSRVKLLDFGIARTAGATGNLTRTGSVLGTPGYMAPEQARGERSIGPRADVFSLGCVLFECLTGRPPFQGIHAMALLAKLLLEEPPHVHELRPDLPRAIGDLIAEMLSKDPALRLPDGAAIYEALEKLDTGTYVDDEPRAKIAEAITDTEKRLVSVVAAMPRIEAPRADSDTLLAPGVDSLLVREVERAVKPLGAKLEVLVNGMILAMLIGTGEPTDQAAMAARCAERMRALMPTARMVLITGRSETTQRLPVGEVLEKAASLIDDREAPAEIGVRIDDLTRALLDTRFEIVEENGRALLRGERSVGDEARTLLGKPSPFVGREREIRNVCDQIEEAFQEKSARAILVTAPAGMGKSRLRQELLRSLRADDPNLAFAIGRADSLGAGSAFALLGSALRSSLGIEAGEPLESQHDKILFWVKLFVQNRSAEQLTVFLGELLGTPFPDDNKPYLRAARQNAQVMSDQIEMAYIEFVRAVAKSRPVLLILEDLHWGDAATVKLLDSALRDLSSLPFVVLAFARPEVDEVFPKLWKGRNRQELRLGSLNRRASERLVRSMLGDTTDAETIAAIVDRADGNAFYLEELIRAFAEGRGNTLPETVLGMVEARLATLSTETRRVLRASSIFGEVFWTNGLRGLLGDDSASVNERLTALVDAEFISKRHSKRFAGEEEYIFRHALVREAAYAMLAQRDRTVGHKLAGEWLERAGEPDPWILAEHFERGQQNAKAAFWHCKAAELAFGANDTEAALLAVTRGLAVDPDGENAADLLGLQTSAAFLKGNYDLALQAAEAVLQRAAPGSVSHCRALMGGIGGSLFLGRFDSLPKFMGQLLTTEAQKATLEPLVGALQWVTSALTMGGQRASAEPFLNRLNTIIDSNDLDNPRSAGEARMGRATWEFYVEQNPCAALLQGLKAAELFELAGDRHRRSAALSGAAWHAGMLGSLEQSDKLFQDALACSPKSSFAVALWQFYRAHQHLEQGKPAEAIADINEALEWERTQTQGVISSAAYNVMAEASLMVGDLDGSEKAFLAAGAGKTGFFVVDMWARGARASRLVVQGEWDEAIRETEDVIATCRQAGVYPARFHLTMLTRAKAYRANGDLDAAKTAIREARDNLLSVIAKMDDVAVQKSFLERIVTHARTMELAKQWLQDEPQN